MDVLETCPRCQRPKQAGSLECMGCGVVFAKYRGQSRPQQDAYEPPLPPAQPAPIQSSKSQWVLPALVALGVLAVVGVKLRPKPPVPLSLEAAQSFTGEDPCLDKARCLVFYTAPWCPACRQSAPLFKEVSFRFQGSPQVGVKAVVGMASRAELTKYAQQLVGAVYLDADGRFHDATNVSGVPTWLVLSAEGRVLEQVTGTVMNADEQLKRLSLDPESRAELFLGPRP